MAPPQGGDIYYLVTHPSGFNESDFIHPLDGDFFYGAAVGHFLYQIANPTISSATEILFREQIKRHDVRAITGVSTSEEYNLANAHMLLQDIICACAGLAYVESKINPIIEDLSKGKDKILEVGERIANGENNVYTHLEMAALESNDYSRGIAQKLYQNKGAQVIRELVPLEFDQAREYILSKIGIDILKPRESMLPRISKSSKTIN